LDIRHSTEVTAAAPVQNSRNTAAAADARVRLIDHNFMLFEAVHEEYSNFS
jgi:hypothetical protein